MVVGDLATLGTAAPVIDGDAGDAAWAAAPLSTIGFTPQSGNNGIIAMEVQAAWLGDSIYFRATWVDPTGTENRAKGQWTFDGAIWSRANADDEDRLYFMFDVAGARGTAAAGFTAGTTTPFPAAGCAISCRTPAT